MTTPSFWQYFTRTANPKQQQAETVMEGVLTAVSVIASGQNPDGTAAPGPTPPTGGAGGDLTGTYPNPTIKASVGLTGSPTATTGTVGDSSTRIATDAFVTTAVNNALAGVNPAVAVQAATTAAGDTSGFTYNNGVAGVGATLTGATNTALTVDGFTFTAIGQRLLVKDDTQSPSGAFNGVYSVTQVQAALLPLILTRATDFDQPSDMNNTGSIPVVNGTVNALTGWLLVSAVATVGTDPLVFSQWPQSGTSVQANGLSTESNGPLSMPQTTDTPITGFYVDLQEGTGVTLGEDGETITIVDAGIYWISAVIQTTSADTSGTSEFQVSLRPSTPFLVGGDAGGFGDALTASPNPNDTSVTVAVPGVMVMSTAANTITFSATPTGGSSNAALSYFGVDVIQIAAIPNL